MRAGRPEAFGVAMALRLATEGVARCPGREDIGRLERGCRADIVVRPGEDLAGVRDALAGLVLGPDHTVRHLLVEGEPVVTDGELLGVDLAAARCALATRARRLWD